MPTNSTESIESPNTTIYCYECEAAQPDGALDWSPVYNTDGMLLCPTCQQSLDWRYARTSRTNQAWVPRDDTTWIQDTDEYVTNEYRDVYCSVHGDFWFRHIPPSCECENCQPDPETCDDSETCECDDCLAARNDGGEHLLCYSADPLELCSGAASVRAAIKRGELLLGVEDEMEAVDGDVDRVICALNGPITARYILKSDGSLRDGVELCSIPMTLASHRDTMDWPAILTPVARIARSGQDTNRCGMHVHVNRRALTPLTVGKLLVAVNAPAMRQLIEAVAQRSANQYCEVKPKRIPDGAAPLGPNKFEALGLRRNTIEFRIFRGNLRPERVMKNLEFVVSLITWARDVSIQHVADPASYLTWLGKRRTEYPVLADYLVSVGQLARPKQHARVIGDI